MTGLTRPMCLSNSSSFSRHLRFYLRPHCSQLLPFLRFRLASTMLVRSKPQSGILKSSQLFRLKQFHGCRSPLRNFRSMISEIPVTLPFNHSGMAYSNCNSFQPCTIFIMGSSLAHPISSNQLPIGNAPMRGIQVFLAVSHVQSGPILSESKGKVIESRLPFS